MNALWLVRTLLFLLAIGLAGNTFVGKMSTATSRQQSAVSTTQTSLSVNTSLSMKMMAGSARCTTSAACMFGNGAACSAGSALVPENCGTLAEWSAANLGVLEIVALVPTQTSTGLFRPPRA